MKQVIQQRRTAAKLSVSLWLLLCVFCVSLLPSALQPKPLASDHLSLLETPFDTGSADQVDDGHALLPALLLGLAYAGATSTVQYLLPGLSPRDYGRQLARAPPSSF